METFKKITVQEAQELMNKESIQWVDIRDQQTFSVGHLKSAVRLDNQNLEEFLASADKNRPLICYCYHGISSQSAAHFLAQKGFQNVYSLEGGFEEWKKVYPALIKRENNANA